MSKILRSRLTLYGLRRLAQTHAGERMVFTSIGLGDVALTNDLSEVTELAGEKQRFPIAGSKVSGNNFWASCKPLDINDPAGIYIRAIGLYIADPDHESDRDYDKLYAVSSIVPDFGEGPGYIAFIPQSPGAAEINYDIRLNTIIASAALVEIVGGIGSLGIATTDTLGLVRSSKEPKKVFVDPATGEMSPNIVLPVIATATEPGLVTSSSEIGKAAINSQTGVITPNGLEDALNAIESIETDQALQWQKINYILANMNNMLSEITENPFTVTFGDESGWEMVSGWWDETNGRLAC